MNTFFKAVFVICIILLFLSFLLEIAGILLS